MRGAPSAASNACCCFCCAYLSASYSCLNVCWLYEYLLLALESYIAATLLYSMLCRSPRIFSMSPASRCSWSSPRDSTSLARSLSSIFFSSSLAPSMPSSMRANISSEVSMALVTSLVTSSSVLSLVRIAAFLPKYWVTRGSSMTIRNAFSTLSSVTVLMPLVVLTWYIPSGP